MSKHKLPSIVIVGRTNVGKSTLFNRLSTNVKAIMMDVEGVTRDFIKDTVCWQGRCFDLIDTGGISLRKTQDFLLEQTRKQAMRAIEDAAVLVFVVDGKAGLLPEDREIAKALRKYSSRVLLVVNKMDAHAAQEQLYEFNQLGFAQAIPVSAQHGSNIADLLEAMVNALPQKGTEEVAEEPKARVVILGKPNVGKSSLLNLLLKEERAIVADIPGTTREAISERIRFHNEDILMTDTPGLRRKRKVTEKLEGMMVSSSFRALEDADIVMLMIDASEGVMSDQELKLAFYAFQEHYKALIILFNKFDLMDEQKKADLEFMLSEYNYFFKKVERLDISCKSEKNVGKILPLINEVWERYNQQFSKSELTQLFFEGLHRKPLYKAGSMLRFYRAEQIKTAPITIALYVELPQFFETSQLAYFERMMRENYDLHGVPVHFVPRKANVD